MVIGTSVIAAIALNEPEAPGFHHKVADDPVRLISAATVLKAAMVFEARLKEAGEADLDLWLHKAEAEVVAVTAEHAGQPGRNGRYFKDPIFSPGIHPE